MLPSTSFHIHYLLIMSSFDSIQPEVLTLSRPQINKNINDVRFEVATVVLLEFLSFLM
jgi:hypothetical protein